MNAITLRSLHHVKAILLFIGKMFAQLYLQSVRIKEHGSCFF